MKLDALVKKPAALTILSILFSVFIAAVSLPVLIGPAFTNWREAVAKNKVETQRLDTITENISLLQSIDRETEEIYHELIDKVIPNSEDKIRVAALIAELVSRSGMSIVTLQTAEGSVVSKTAVPGEVSAEGSNAAATKATPTPVKSNSYSFNVTLAGDFSATNRLLNLLNNVKRSIRATQITSTVSPDFSVTINFSLPTSSVSGKLSAEEKLRLTSADKEYLDQLLRDLTIDADPSNQPVGRGDPFR